MNDSQSLKKTLDEILEIGALVLEAIQEENWNKVIEQESLREKQMENLVKRPYKTASDAEKEALSLLIQQNKVIEALLEKQRENCMDELRKFRQLKKYTDILQNKFE